MRMLQVRQMRMIVFQKHVRMNVAVFAAHTAVSMKMMAIVMCVTVFMCNRLMCMYVRMTVRYCDISSAKHYQQCNRKCPIDCFMQKQQG